MASGSLIVPIAKRTTSILARTAGLAGAAAIIYDAHKCGQSDAKSREYIESTDILIKQFNDSKISNSRSTIASRLQDKLFDIRLNSGYNGFIANVKGYASGFFSQLATTVVPLALSAGALFLKKGSKLCAAGLAICGLKTLICDVAGIGRSPKQKV